MISIKRFARNQRGSIATMFAVSFIPAMLVTGAAIDFSRSVTQWSNLQQATDATALSTAHTFLNASSTASALQTYAQSYLSGLMNNATVTSVVLSQGNTRVCVYSSYPVQTAVMQIAGIKTVNVSTSACSQTGDTFEIALALDNSGSMSESAGGQSKIQALQSAAKQLVSILIPSGTTTPQAAISIVPFTSMVNVGGGTNSPSWSFLDKSGQSSIHWQNFHRPSGATFVPTSKFDLYKNMTNTTWGGCVEERPPPYTTTDTAASSSTPDSMFVPYFAPDEPGAVNNSSGYACFPTGSSQCARSLPPYIYFNSYIGDNGSATSGVGVCTGSSDNYAKADSAQTYSGDNQTNIYPGSGITEVCKYKGTAASTGTNYYGEPSGPNMMCNSQQLTPLTTDTTVLNNSISSMVAFGSTDLAAGFMWAWRTISPIVNPFPTTSAAAIGPQNPKPYNYSPPQNHKIIILMTDGTNSWTANPYDKYFQSLYEGFGYYANNRIASYNTSALPGGYSCSGSTTTSSTSRCFLDNVTAEACNNAKNAPDPVTIYTIGFSIPSDPIDATGVALLQGCASGASNYYPATDSASITAAFQSIAQRIQSLRLTQ